MKIAFLNRYQAEIERGAEVFTLELVKRLSKDHSVDIFFGEKADSLKEVVEGRYDVVIPVNGRMQSLKVSLAKLLGGYKVLITGHSGKGWDDIWNIAVARPDVFVALTDDTAKWVRQWAWGSRVVKINNGIDLDKFSPRGEKIKIDLPRPIILSVGALVWYKHHKSAIEAVSELDKGSLLIAGEGPLKKELTKLAQERIPGRFMVSRYKYEQMPQVYRSCDLFTLPSWDREAFGIVYLEALASGLGVVAPNDLSREEIIEDGGILVNVDDISLYSQAIIKSLKINWQKKARAQAEKFSWEKIAQEYETVLTGLKND